MDCRGNAGNVPERAVALNCERSQRNYADASGAGSQASADRHVNHEPSARHYDKHRHRAADRKIALRHNALRPRRRHQRRPDRACPRSVGVSRVSRRRADRGLLRRFSTMQSEQFAAAHELSESRCARVVLVSLGSNGALLATQHASRRLSAIPMRGGSGVWGRRDGCRDRGGAQSRVAACQIRSARNSGGGSHADDTWYRKPVIGGCGEVVRSICRTLRRQ